MGRRKDDEMRAIIDAICDDVMGRRKRDVLTLSANDIAREYGIHPNTATTILRNLGLEFDGVYWYFVDEAE
jgi:hypothetical protein